MMFTLGQTVTAEQFYRTANIQGYESHFPAGLAPKPGFIWDSSEYGVEQLYSWSSISNDFVVHKLPKVKILKRKEL